jgi:phasin family protein
MFPFSQPVNPVLRSYLDSQLAFFNDLSTSLSGTFQSICDANLKLSRTMLEESMGAGQRMLASKNVSDAFGAAASSAQPAADKLRAYQQHLSRLTADSQVELARVTQQHGEETSRTAHALSDEVTRAATEASEQNTRQKEDFLKQFRDPFQKEAAAQANGAFRAKASAQDAREGVAASMQSAGEALFRGNAQGHPAQPAEQPGNKQSGNK